MKYIFNFTVNDENKKIELEGDYKFSVTRQNHMPVTFMFIGYFSSYDEANSDAINQVYQEADRASNFEVKIVELENELTIFKLDKIEDADLEIGLIEEYNTREIIEAGRLLKTVVRVR